jgi:hypothetical protein
MRKSIANGLLIGGACMGLASAFAELKTAATWAEVMSPSHFFGALGAVVTAIGAFYRPAPKQQAEI